MSQPSFAFWNYRTGRYDYIQGAPVDWRDYIPQDEASLGVYDCNIALDMSPKEAALYVLKLVIGDNNEPV